MWVLLPFFFGKNKRNKKNRDSGARADSAEIFLARHACQPRLAEKGSCGAYNAAYHPRIHRSAGPVELSVGGRGGGGGEGVRGLLEFWWGEGGEGWGGRGKRVGRGDGGLLEFLFMKQVDGWAIDGMWILVRGVNQDPIPRMKNPCPSGALGHKPSIGKALARLHARHGSSVPPGLALLKVRVLTSLACLASFQPHATKCSPLGDARLPNCSLPFSGRQRRSSQEELHGVVEVLAGGVGLPHRGALAGDDFRKSSGWC